MKVDTHPPQRFRGLSSSSEMLSERPRALHSPQSRSSSFRYCSRPDDGPPANPQTTWLCRAKPGVQQGAECSQPLHEPVDMVRHTSFIWSRLNVRSNPSCAAEEPVQRWAAPWTS